MKGLPLALRLLLMVGLLLPHGVRAESNTSILIVELQTRSAAATGAADQEFIELFNVADEAVDLSSWRLEYKSATGTTWSTKVALRGTLGSGQRYLLASKDYLTETADDTFSSGISDTGGHMRLVSLDTENNKMVKDLVGWGNADSAEGNAPASALGPGKSLQRKTDESEHYIDTENNQADFVLSNEPTPESTYEEPEPEPDQPPADNVTNRPPDNPGDTPDNSTEEPPITPDPEQLPEKPLEITELLPNPAAPATDSKDEYVELYNPNDDPIDLRGYRLQTGSSFTYNYTVPNITIAPQSYIVFTSGETPLSLANSKGRARLLAPDNTVMAITGEYEDAPEGQAWILHDDKWQWSTTPTPMAANSLSVPPIKVDKAAAAVAAKPKANPAKLTGQRPAAKKSTVSSKAKTASAKKAGTTKSSKNKASSKQPNATLAATDSNSKPPLHPLLLAGVGVGALVYAAYEYRHDIANRLYQLRSYRAARRAARTSTSGR